MQIFDDNYSFLKENRNAELVLYSVKGGREEQQDCSGYEIADDRLMAVICDGMGGENDGKKASNTAVGEFLNQYLLSENDGKQDDFFEKAIVSANSAICSFTDKNGNMVCAGTTVVCILIADGLLRWASVGDSRLYILRDNELVQATTDHNYALSLSEQLKNGNIDRQTYETEMLQGDGLTSFLGVGREMQVDINVRGIPLHSGDRILMTTDGLYKLVSDEEINRILTNFKNIGEAVQALEMKAVHGALKKRTVRDNMTIALVNIK